MDLSAYSHVYGVPPVDLVGDIAGLAQLSPFSPGAQALDEAAPQSIDGLVMLAPPGAIERRYALALALNALKPGAPLLALAPKDKGGSRLAQDLTGLGCAFEESARRHHRICLTQGPGDPAALAAAIAEGAPRLDETLGLWTQPGVFSWNRIDPGSALLIANMPPLAGRGADLGCGLGVLSHAALASPKVKSLLMIDLDRRALECAKRNVADARAAFMWGDGRKVPKTLETNALDFVVMNPPFHESGHENRTLGQSFIQSAAAMLRTGGVLWLTANRHLPYESILKPLFKRATLIKEAGGFKIYQAQK
ncbi:MAG: rsmC [Hyphomicrobiales bacterium]|nr:rsmC [Hyphomicrobiales bacterium]